MLEKLEEQKTVQIEEMPFDENLSADIPQSLGEKFHPLLDEVDAIIGLFDAETFKRVAVNRFKSKLLGYSPAELAKLPIVKIDFERNRTERFEQLTFAKGGGKNKFERQFHTKNGAVLDILLTEKLIEIDGKRYIIQTGRDVTELRNTQRQLNAAKKEMELKVQERTAELEKMNTTLTVLLKKLDQEKQEMEETLVVNFKALVDPYLEKLRKAESSSQRDEYLNIIQSNLKTLFQPLLHRTLKDEFSIFTPTEIRIANLIKQGKTSKEISTILNLSLATIAWHRKNLRKKLNIDSATINLRSYLMTHLK
jgi:PAS domain S-box-containing protein